MGRITYCLRVQGGRGSRLSKNRRKKILLVIACKKGSGASLAASDERIN
jgi:hypothetical protein